MSSRLEFLGAAPVGQTLIRLSIPAITGMLVMASYNVVDAAFVGRGVGADALGALGAAVPIFFIVQGIALLIGIGSASTISRSLGAGDVKAAEGTLGTCISVSLAAGLTVLLLGRFTLPILMALTEAPESLRPLISEYLRTIFLGSPFLVAGIAMNCVIRAEGRAAIAMLTLIISAGVNVVLDPLFIFVLHMGISGAATATVIAQAVTFLWALGHYLTPGRSSVTFRRQNLLPTMPILKNIATIGGTEFARIGTQAVTVTVVLNRLSHYGDTTALAAYAILFKVMALSIMPIFGIGQGLQPLVGYAHGAGNPERVRRAVLLAIFGATIIAASTELTLIIWPRSILAIFTTDPQLLDVAVDLARKSLLCYAAVGFQIMGTVTFQAMGLSKPAMILSLSRQILFLIPMLFILPTILGLSGVFFSFPLADLAAAFLTFWLLKTHERRSSVQMEGLS